MERKTMRRVGRKGVRLLQQRLIAKPAPWRPLVGLLLIAILLANLLLVGLRVYRFTFFWIILVVVLIVGWLLGMINKNN
jgi:hypothetical protein